MTADTVQVWLIPVDQPGAPLADLAGLLDPAEQARAAALTRPEQRRRYVAAHAAARLILAGRLGLPAERIRWQRGRYGKPELAGSPAPPVRTSLSHSGEFALLAVTARRPVGVDLQRLPAHLDVARMAARYYPAAEARFVAAGADPAERAGRYARLWTRKEACVKAGGGRLTEGLRLPVHGTMARPRRDLGGMPDPGREPGPGGTPGTGGDRPALVRDPGGPLPGPYLVGDLPAPAGFHAALALAGTGPYRVQRRDWPGPGGHPLACTVDSVDPEPMAVEHA